MLILTLILPFVGSITTILLKQRYRANVGQFFALAIMAVVLDTVVTHGPGTFQHHQLGGWPAPLGIALHADGLSVLFLMLTGLTGTLVSFYAGAYFPARPETVAGGGHFWPLWLFLWGGLNGLFLSSDIFNLYVLLEVVGLSAVALATLSRRPAALNASLRYLLAAMVGSLIYLFGVAVLYANYGMLDLRLLSATLAPDLPTLTAFALMLFGLLIKTALFPFHFWLPPAHGNAAAPVSAILSALVVKSTFYLVVRIWFVLFPLVTSYGAAQFLGGLGGLAILWGSFQAIRQKRLKLLVAHSTVGQIGYLFLLFPLTTPVVPGQPPPSWSVQAWTGGFCQAFSHALAKAALFLAVGNIIYILGTDNRRSLRDMAGRKPLTIFTLALSGVSLIGLPPSGGFVAKWMTMNAVLASGQWWWIPVVVAGSLLTAGYVFLILANTLWPSSGQSDLEHIPRAMEYSALLLAVGAILMGFFVEDLSGLLGTFPQPGWTDLSLSGGRP